MWYVPNDLMGAAFDHNHTAIGWNKKVRLFLLLLVEVRL